VGVGKIREMVSRNPGPISGHAQPLKARQYIWIEFLWPKCVALSRLALQSSLLNKVNPWPENLKGAVMVFTSFDYASQNGVKLQRLQA